MLVRYRLKARLGGQGGGGPEAAQPLHIFRSEIHMGRKAGGKAADFAAAHGVGLAGDREGRRARLADAAGGEVDVDDRVPLVAAADRLVDALAEQRDGARLGGAQLVELFQQRVLGLAGLRRRPEDLPGPDMTTDIYGRVYMIRVEGV